MIRLLVNGLCGQMGRALLRTIPKMEDQVQIVCGVDPNGANVGVPLYASCTEVDTPFDAAIDFSVPNAAMEVLHYCKEHGKPIVICTTGLNADQIAEIEKVSQTIPVFRSGNMSLGINLLRSLCKQARVTLGDAFDVEIVEAHHNRKIDAPSGTAHMLYDAVSSVSEKPTEPVYGRHDANRRRTQSEIGIHSIRGGTIVGEHEVLFIGPDEVVTLKHQAFSKSVFALGALKAAVYLAEKTPGLYDMDHLVSELLND